MRGGGCLGVVEFVDCLGQRVIVANAIASDRDVLRTATRTMGEQAVALELAGVQGLFKPIEQGIRRHTTAATQPTLWREKTSITKANLNRHNS